MYKLASGTAVAVVLLLVLSQPALARVERIGLGDGPVLVLRDGVRPGDVAQALRREKLDPAEAAVRARASSVGGYEYTVSCDLPAGDQRGRVYTVKLRSTMEPATFRRLLRAAD
jgi:hypothetical protein